MCKFLLVCTVHFLVVTANAYREGRTKPLQIHIKKYSNGMRNQLKELGVISGEGDGVLVEHFVLFWFSRCDSEVASLVASRRGASATAAALVSREHPVLGGGTCAHAVRVRARLLAGRRALVAEASCHRTPRMPPLRSLAAPYCTPQWPTLGH